MLNEREIAVINQCEGKGPSVYGREAFFKSLQDKGCNIKLINYWTEVNDKKCVLIGKTDSSLIRRLLEWNGVEYVNEPEGVLLQWCSNGDGETLVIAGTDDVGLMYALLEVAGRVSSYGIQGLINVNNVIELPDNKVRSVSRFVMSHRDDDWYYSEEFWNYYFKRLAGYRFNRFVLILGFDTPYMAPPYPFLVEVPGYPNVRVKDLSDSVRERNLSQLRRIGQLCRKYGLEYNVATWQQTPWNNNQKLMVEGLAKNEDDLGDYCATGLKVLLNKCPEIEVLQLRVNHEAGVGDQNTNEAFWKKMITAVSEVDHKVKLDLRAKGLTDGMIQFALEKGLELTVPTKHWCEHIALPYHLSKMREEELTQLGNLNHSRRYSYADLLRKPRFFDMIYRLWNYGSNTLFLWGDPDYVRRFSYSCRYGGAKGFEITAPLSLKGGQATIEGEAWPLFDNVDFRHYQWEDERYWAYYMFFGRISYSSKTPEDVWIREFETHFGEAAAYMEQAYRSASKILPLITAFHMPVHPSLTYWPELCTGAALFKEHNFNPRYNITYQDSEPSDSGLFYGISEYAGDVLKGNVSCRYTPLQVRYWLSIFIEDIRSAVEKAETCETLKDNKEFKATRNDFLMLADLAEYHANKITAALELSFYHNTNIAGHLEKSCRFAVASKKCWESLCERGNAYHFNLEFGVAGVGRSRHWKDRLEELEKDVDRLESLLKEKRMTVQTDEKEMPLKQSGCEVLAGSLPYYVTDVPECWTAGKDLVINTRIGESMRHLGGLKMHYRHMNQLEGKFKVVEMKRSDAGYTGVISGEYLTLEWDVMIYFSGVDENNNVSIYPGLYHPRFLAPYHVVKIVENKCCTD